MTPNSLEEQLVRDEGEVLHAYKDSLGYLTIGVGHLIDPVKGGSIPQPMSRQLLAYDIQQKSQELFSKLPWAQTLDDVRREALINMAFNLGVDGLLKFANTLSEIRTGDYAGASEAMLQSRWAGQVGDRAQRLALQIKTGVRQ